MNKQKHQDNVEEKKQWHRPRLIALGKITELVQQGGGKTEITTGDPGEPRKVPPTG